MKIIVLGFQARGFSRANSLLLLLRFMKSRLITFIFAGLASLADGSPSLSGLPMRFERNVGQAAADVRYLGHDGQGAILLKSREVVFLGPQGPIGMRFRGARVRARMDATGETSGVSNYFLESRSIRNVHQYERVIYRDLYPGISLALRGTPSALEYDFVLAPGANLRQVRFAFVGVAGMEITRSGDLVLRTPSGELRHKRPVAFQEIGGNRRFVGIAYQRAGKGLVVLRADGYDRTAPLVIDPAVIYTSPLTQDGIGAIAVDAAGNVYLTGASPSGRGACGSYSLFGQTHYVPCNGAIVVKLDVSGTQVLYRTMLAGSSEDRGISIAADDAGNVYILGNTYSPDFPVTPNAAQTKYAGPPKPSTTAPTAGGDLFISKLDPFGLLIYSTFLGGRTTSWQAESESIRQGTL